MARTNYSEVAADNFIGNTAGSHTGAVDGALGGTTPAAASVTDFTQNGVFTRTIQTLAAAGATQLDAGAITKSTVVVTVTASTQGVRLPAAAAGKEVRVAVPGLVGVLVYPATSDAIGSASADAGVLLAAGKMNIYQAIDATTWAVLIGA